MQGPAWACWRCETLLAEFAQRVLTFEKNHWLEAFSTFDFEREGIDGWRERHRGNALLRL